MAVKNEGLPDLERYLEERGRHLVTYTEGATMYHMDKKDYYTASFSDLSAENEQGDVTEFEPGSSDMMPSGDRYLKILEDLIAHVAESNPLYGDIIRMREQGVGQADIAKSIGKS